jgi:hypothetical protein
MKTFTAINWPPLGNAKRDRGFLAALRANSLGFGALDRTDLALRRLAIFATLWFVFETLVGEKQLFASSKNKLRTASSAFQDLIVVFH